jgi:hypothetical protein
MITAKLGPYRIHHQTHPTLDDVRVCRDFGHPYRISCPRLTISATLAGE